MQRRGYILWGSVGLLALTLALWMRAGPLESTLAVVSHWITALGWWGPAAFVILYIAATLLLLPAWALTIAAGTLFGWLPGTLLVSFSATTGAALALLMARYVARERVTRRFVTSPAFVVMDQAIGAGGWKMVALLRLSPAVPFTVQNYFYGLTAIPFWTCVLTSWVAMLPGTSFYVYLGYLGGAGLHDMTRTAASVSLWPWILRGIGLAATVAVTVYITVLARRTLHTTAVLGTPSGTTYH